MKTASGIRVRTFLLTLCLVMFGFMLFIPVMPDALAQSSASYWFDLRLIETGDAGIRRPRGSVYVPYVNRFIVFNRRGDYISMSPGGDGITTQRVAPGAQWSNAVFDEKNQRLLTTDRQGTVWQLAVNANGETSAQVQRAADFTTAQMPAQGSALDSQNQRLWLLDGRTAKLGSILSSGSLEMVDLAAFARAPLRGLAFNPRNGHLYSYSLAEKIMYEFTTDAQLVAKRDLASLQLHRPGSMFFAPSGDSTDDPSRLNLYIVENGGKKRVGGIFEISLTPPVRRALTESSHASLVKQTITGNWSPNSPDPAGVVYSPNANALLVSDSEAEEMPQYFVGKNMFQASRGGSLQRTFTSFTSNPTGLAWNNYSGEPSGLGLNPNNNHLFVSDDSKDKIFEVNPGNDGQLGTSDDTVTSFSTSAFGATDPEDVAYGNGKLYVFDGVNIEVYIVNPGNNGVFDGVPPAGDDTTNHFDVEQYGVRDAEGGGYNPATNTLFVVDRRGPLVEVTLNGSFIRSIDISFLNPITPADVAIAPGSENSAVDNLYLVDRMIDNTQDPDETDGRMSEIALGDSPPPTPTPDPSSNLLANAGFELDANGNNLPDDWTQNNFFTRTNQDKHSGSHAGKHSAVTNPNYNIEQTVNNLSAGTSYIYSGWVNIPATSDTFSLKLQVRWKNASGGTISTSTIKTFSKATNGWTFANGALVAPAGTVKAQIRMRVTSLDATLYVDDLFFGQ